MDIKKEKITTIIGILSIVIIYILIYPKFITISDEPNYLTQASLITEGKLWQNNPIESYHHKVYNNHYISKYSPAIPFLISIPLLINWKLIFIVNIIIHIIGFFIFRGILSKLKIDKVYSLLYLIHPSLILFSRTIMSETGTAVAILAGFYYYINKGTKNDVVSGFFFSLACLFRYPALIFISTFFVISFFKNKKKFFAMLIGFAPLTIVILIYNYFAFGGLLNSGFKTVSSSMTIDKITFLLNTIKTYLNYMITLNLIYPLMLISILFYKKEYKKELIITIISSIIIFGFANNSIFRFSFIENAIFGIRYILPIVPLMIIMYSEVIDNIIKKVNLKKLLPIIFTSILLISIAVTYKHQELSKDYKKITDNIYKNIPENSLITGDVFSRIFISPVFGKQKGMSIGDQYLTQESYKIPTYIIAISNVRWKETCERVKIENPETDCDLQELKSIPKELKDKNELWKIIPIDDNTLYIFKIK